MADRSLLLAAVLGGSFVVGLALWLVWATSSASVAAGPTLLAADPDLARAQQILRTAQQQAADLNTAGLAAAAARATQVAQLKQQAAALSAQHAAAEAANSARLSQAGQAVDAAAAGVDQALADRARAEAAAWAARDVEQKQDQALWEATEPGLPWPQCRPVACLNPDGSPRAGRTYYTVDGRCLKAAENGGCVGCLEKVAAGGDPGSNGFVSCSPSRDTTQPEGVVQRYPACLPDCLDGGYGRAGERYVVADGRYCVLPLVETSQMDLDALNNPSVDKWKEFASCSHYVDTRGPFT